MNVSKQVFMNDKDKDLPVNSGVNPKNDDTQLKNQEEYDNLGKDEKQRESQVRDTQRADQRPE